MEYTTVGGVRLPELPPGTPVAWDTEGSGLYGDGDPIPAGSRAAQPPARVSAVSIAYRDPDTGELVDHAWPFDQGPLIGKPGKPVKDPETGVCTFEPIDEAEQQRLLAVSSKVLGREVTLADAAPNLDPEEYAKLVEWLDQRDTLVAHNSVHDMHVMRYGLRESAGGFDVRDGGYSWDTDSAPGSWAAGRFTPQVGAMEPTSQPMDHRGRRTIWCTMVTQKQLIAPLQPAALKPTSRRLWGADSTDEEAELKAELSKQGTGMTKRYDLLPWCGSVGRYASKDAELCLRLYEYQQELVEQGATLPRFWELHEAEMQLRTTLYRMERRGVSYDADRSWAQGEQLRTQNAELAAKMPFDPSKPAQAKRFYFGPHCTELEPEVYVLDGGDFTTGKLYPRLCPKSCPSCGGKNGLGLEPTERTEKTRAPKLDVSELRKLVEEGQPWATEYALWTKRRNSDAKWYTGWAARTGPDGRIRTSFKQCRNDVERAGGAAGGTKSGRLAVGRWQCQAIPHGHLIPEGAVPVRQLINYTPGKVRFEHDLATGELRVVTVIANSTKLWDALDQGLDAHGMNAQALFGVTPDDPDFKVLRSAAKRATFGILYGGGPKAIRDQIYAASGKLLSLQQVKDAIESFFETYPEFQRMAIQAEDKVNRYRGGCGYLTMLDGWRRWYAPEERASSAVNQIIQGNLARAVNQWMIEVERRLPGALLLQVHDSLITEHDDTEEGGRQAQQVSDIGNEVLTRYFNVRGRTMHFGIEPERWDSKS